MDVLVDPFTATPSELLASVADLEPGPLLMSHLLMVDRETLDPDDALLYLTLHDRIASWWVALQSEALVAAASAEPRIDEFLVLDPRPDHHEERLLRIEDAAREEVAAALRMPPVTAQRRIDHARLLHRYLPGTRSALVGGVITPAHAAVICEAVLRLSSRATGAASALDERDAGFARDCRNVEARVLPTASRSTVGRLRRATDRVVEAIDGDGQRLRRSAARVTRDVFLVTEPCDGISTLIARLDTAMAHAVMCAVNAGIDNPDVPGDCASSIGERRAEVLAALILHGADSPERGRKASGEPSGRSRAGVGVSLDVTVALDVLLGLSDGAGVLSNGDPLPMEQLRTLMADPEAGVTLRRLVTDPLTGAALDLGRRRYEVSGPLRRLIVARDRACRFPGCGRRADACQIDHAEPWDDGGASDRRNLGALCTRHHQLKTHGGWRIVESDETGACTWVSPAGFRYAWKPEPVASPSPPARSVSERDRASVAASGTSPPF